MEICVVNVMLMLCCCSCVKRRGIVDVEGENEFVGLRIMKKINIKGMKMMKKFLVMMNEVVGVCEVDFLDLR